MHLYLKRRIKVKNKKVKQMIESITGGRYTTLYNLDTGGECRVVLVFWSGAECFNGKVSVTAEQLSSLQGAL